MRTGSDSVEMTDSVSLKKLSTINPMLSPLINVLHEETKIEVEIEGESDFIEHKMSFQELTAKFGTSINPENIPKSKGLTNNDAFAKYKEFGPNLLSPPPKRPLWMLFLLQFTNPLMLLLMITAGLCIILYIINPSVPGNLYIGVLLLIVVVITCYETFSQEAKSDSLMEKFRALIPEKANVLRDGVLNAVDSSFLVPGDIILLKLGDKIPADCRVVYNESMKVDQSMITGESEAVDISVKPQDNRATEAKNIIFNGSLVVDGSCYAVAIRTGDKTFIGNMVKLTGDVGKASSTLKADIEYFVKVLTIFALGQATLVFIVGSIRGFDPIQLFIQGFVTIMIGNVPQGLPTTVTACLYLVAEGMTRQNVFVKKLDIIETLGSCNVICTDKTGTLTQNKMKVANLWIFSRLISAEDFSNDPDSPATIAPSLSQLLQIAMLNSRVMLETLSEDDANLDNQSTSSAAMISGKNKPHAVPVGDATEIGIYNFCQDYCADHQKNVEDYRQDFPKTLEIPFTSSLKWQLSIHLLKTAEQVLFMKGAPDILLSKCNRFLNYKGELVPIDEEFNANYQQIYEKLGSGGERVIGFVMRPIDSDEIARLTESPQQFREELKARLTSKGKDGKPVDEMNDLIFVGLITLKDPPRVEVPKAIQDCSTAGIKVVMVTGDHPITAAAIGRQIGLITRPTREEIARTRAIPLEEVAEDEVQALIIPGSAINQFNEQDWQRLVHKKEIIFARTSPEQKLIIVKEFSKAGNVTAMTGDGVNDSPALKQASIGIAMGIAGTAVAKEAADLILLDDNFASIVVGIREGRLLFQNLRKSIAYTLAHLTPEVVPVLMWGLVGTPQPMGALFALCIDLITELTPATSFAFEKAEGMIMRVPPRNLVRDKLTTWNLLSYSYFQAGIILTIGCYFYYFQVFQRYGVSVAQVFDNNNRYFPYTNEDFTTTDGSGRVYDEHEQGHIVSVLQTGWFIMIWAGQLAHVWTCRTTVESIFTHGFFDNTVTNYGIFVSSGIGLLISYCPGIRAVVGSANPFSLPILYSSLLVWGLIWIYTEGKKYVKREYPSHWINSYTDW